MRYVKSTAGWKILASDDWAGSPCGWFAVSDGEQIVALFKRGCDANRFVAAKSSASIASGKDSLPDERG